jgi:hypothetical protein
MDKVNQPRIFWMLDESIAHSKPSNWGRVISLEEKLVNLCGNPKFKHELPNPIDGLTNISRELGKERFTTIIDLTGWLSPSLRDLFPFTPIVNTFSLSRIRVTSSPNLETSGYTVSMNRTEIDEMKKGLNFEKTLMIDDTTFTGWTSGKTMEYWNLAPKNVTHAFLIANTGKMGRKQKETDPEPPLGAAGLLRSMGSKVVFGHELITPDDDGWHLKDLHQHPRLGEAFNLGLQVLQLMDNEGPDSEIVKSTLKRKEIMDVLFPERLTSSEINHLMAEGKFISSGRVDLSDNELVHTKNPLLWASRYFREHIDLQKTIVNKNEIMGVLTELHSLTEDPEALRESSQELRRILKVEMGKNGPEAEFPLSGLERRYV